MNTLRWIYKILRSVLLASLLTIVGLTIVGYILLSIPPVHDKIRDIAEKELTAFLGNPVEIRKLTFMPMSEVIIQDADFIDSNGNKCLEINKLGAGINMWRLIFKGEIEITYIELIGFKGNIYQSKEGEPLNIDYLIKAFSKKDENKPPAQFDLKIHNIVLRGGELSFSKLWKEKQKDNSKLDFNYLHISDLHADIALPKLSNDLQEIDLKRLAFREQSGLTIKELSGFFTLTPQRLSANSFTLRLPETVIETEDFVIPLEIFNQEKEGTATPIRIKLKDSRVTPANLAAFLPVLEKFNFSIPISATLSTDLVDLDIEDFQIKLPENTGSLLMRGSISNLKHLKTGEINIEELNLNVDHSLWSILKIAFPNVSIFSNLIQLPDLDLNLSGLYNFGDGKLKLNNNLLSQGLQFDLDVDGVNSATGFNGKMLLQIGSLKIGDYILNSPVTEVSDAKISFEGNINYKDFFNSTGTSDIQIASIDILNRQINNITGQIDKNVNNYNLELSIDDKNLNGSLTAGVILNGADTSLDLEARINDFDSYNSLLTEFGDKQFEMEGLVKINAKGNNIDNISGNLEVKDFALNKISDKKLYISNLLVEVNQGNPSSKSITINSDFFDAELNGDYILSRLPAMVKEALYSLAPVVFRSNDGNTECGRGDFKIHIKDDLTEIIDFFNLPIFPLTEMEMTGHFDGYEKSLELTTEIPFIQQGSNKLIQNTYLDIILNGKERKADIFAGTLYPTKKGDLKIDLTLEGGNDNYNINILFNKDLVTQFYGELDLDLELRKDELTNELIPTLIFLPTSLYLNNAEWKIEESSIEYSKEALSVKNFSVRHEDQFVTINGRNYKDGEGEIEVNLADINLDYIFDTLNINHVTFGGNATGKAVATGLLTADPDIHTEDLFVKNLSYNGAVLGDGDLFGALRMKEKMVEIKGEIQNDSLNVAKIDGGVWFGRDSLSFNFDANHVDIAFMQPFMKAFSSKVSGKASGNAHLYGTFSDIDMTGKLIAEEADILIDYTDVHYIGSDTIYLTPGKIEIPNFLISDQYGNTASVNGIITHEYFHLPAFHFTVSDMRHLLVYDTNPKMNQLWYGKIFANGAGEIVGKPGSVRISADVITEPGSDFTFVLSDQLEAVKSKFLTFSDKRKEAYEASLPREQEPEFLKRFRKKTELKEEIPDVFTMDIRASVTPDIQFNLIMDPIAGDKITAYGDGAMNMTYNSQTDDLRLYGKYTLVKGNYNFSLQDIILKDFTIKPGSTIAFTGNPYTGVLDITAAYKVNTSLTELDQSFATDKDLNRTSVPVEALLKVSGVLTSPLISFDIDLPTVTEETLRKVKSIISTDDMMSRQVLYLVALNKFYPPEYMSTSNSGGEWASIASSTLSSQLQNLIGQITDKFTIAPSIRSDKGDFSDVEVDIALSSNLFNNRLLLNGNIGYRDPSNSSTTFIGDFDLEYLLNRSGTWRLKAYNHFNDQNYYLKSALTTQGVGLMWRKDFGYLNSKRKKRENTTEEDKKEEKSESPDINPEETQE